MHTLVSDSTPQFSLLDLSSLSEKQRLAFYGALFAIADTDEYIDRVESDLIFQSLDLTPLSDSARQRVLAEAIAPPPLTNCAKALADAPEVIRKGLLLNLVDIVVADAKIDSREYVGLEKVRQILGATHEDLAQMHVTAMQVRQAEREGKVVVRRPLQFN